MKRAPSTEPPRGSRDAGTPTSPEKNEKLEKVFEDFMDDLSLSSDVQDSLDLFSDGDHKKKKKKKKDKKKKIRRRNQRTWKTPGEEKNT